MRMLDSILIFGRFRFTFLKWLLYTAIATVDWGKPFKLLAIDWGKPFKLLAIDWGKPF